MKKIYFILISLLMSAVLNAQDDDFLPSNSYVVFEASSDAPSSTLSFENKSANDIDVGSLSIIGAHSDEFNLTNDGCSEQTLSADESCNVELKFSPKNEGIKNALLKVPYDTKILYVFLTNHEDNKHNVEKRLVPVVYDDINISEKMDANISYTLKWSLIGYHDGYKVISAMFDCTDKAAGECGADYNDNFLESGSLSAISSESVDWTYRDQNATKFDYTWTTTIPEKRANGDDWNSTGTDIVIRFYVISDEDEENGKSTISLVIPGNLSDRYYDTSGRKIEKTICPEGGCSDE